MPIEPSSPITVLTQDEFHEVDRVMMHHAFKIHNRFGRLLDEKIYKDEMASRCAASGLRADREFSIQIKHGGFVKAYRIDLLLGSSTVVEAKTASVLTDAHRGQGINYLFLAGTQHGSLVNLRTSSVVREFLSTQYTPESRRRFEVASHAWPNDVMHDRVQEVAIAFCLDVGLGLDLALYREAFAMLTGNANRQLVPLTSNGRCIGQHEMHLLTAECGLAVTALEETDDYRKHMLRLLNLTPLEGLAWINLRMGQLSFEHLRK
jgi:GxxExxY protein